MSDYYTVLGKYYDQGTVISVDIDIPIEKLDKTFYQATRITYRDKGDGKSRDACFPTAFLNITPFQAELKAAITALKAGDEITFLKEHRYVTSAGAGMTKEQIKEKRLARYNIVKVLQGHVIPEECSTRTNSPGGAPTFQKRDTSGIEKGHAINAARNLLTAAQLKVDKTFIGAACKLHDLTVELKKSYASTNPKMSDYDVGATVGHAVLGACTEAKKFSEVEALAQRVLDTIGPAVLAHIQTTNTTVKEEVVKEEPKAESKAKKETAPELEKEEETVTEDDGLDF